MAFPLKLTLSLGRSPPLLRRCIAGGTTSIAKAITTPSSPPAPLLPLLPPCPLSSLRLPSTSLSLSPNSPIKYHELINVLSTTNQSTSAVVPPEIVSEKIDEEIGRTNYNHQSTNIVSMKIMDKQISSSSNTCSSSSFQLFGFWIESDSSSSFQNKSEGISNVKKKKRKRSAEEEEVSNFKPLKKREKPSSSSIDNNASLFKMKKILIKSDVNQCSRLLLGNNNEGMIDKVVSNLNLTGDLQECFKQGININVYDLDIKEERNLILKRWSTNSFILNSGWSDKFVKERNLEKGDEIQLEWDQTLKRLNFSLVKRALELNLFP